MANLCQNLNRAYKIDPTTTSRYKIDEAKMAHHLYQTVLKCRLILTRAQDSIKKLTSSPTSVMNVQSNSLEPHTPVSNSYRTVIHNATLSSPHPGVSPKAVNVPVDLGTNSIQF